MICLCEMDEKEDRRSVHAKKKKYKRIISYEN